jgi:hypothetical protein
MPLVSNEGMRKKLSIGFRRLSAACLGLSWGFPGAFGGLPLAFFLARLLARLLAENKTFL